MNPSIISCPQTTPEVRGEYMEQLDGLKALIVERVMRKLAPADRPLFDQWRDSFMRGDLDSHKLLQQLLDR